MDLPDIVSRIGAADFIYPPTSAEDLNAARVRGIPDSLLELFRLVDGLYVIPGDDFLAPNGQSFRFKIPRLRQIESVAEAGYCPSHSPMVRRLERWWQFLDCGDGNWVGMTDSEDHCRIVDLFHETIGAPGSHAVIADSLERFLELLLEHQGMFWLGEEFPKVVWI